MGCMDKASKCSAAASVFLTCVSRVWLLRYGLYCLLFACVTLVSSCLIQIANGGSFYVKATGITYGKKMEVQLPAGTAPGSIVTVHVPRPTPEIIRADSRARHGEVVLDEVVLFDKVGLDKWRRGVVVKVHHYRGSIIGKLIYYLGLFWVLDLYDNVKNGTKTRLAKCIKAKCLEVTPIDPRLMGLTTFMKRYSRKRFFDFVMQICGKKARSRYKTFAPIISPLWECMLVIKKLLLVLAAVLASSYRLEYENWELTFGEVCRDNLDDGPPTWAAAEGSYGLGAGKAVQDTYYAGYNYCKDGERLESRAQSVAVGFPGGVLIFFLVFNSLTGVYR